jgi:hypothetical protein
MLSADPQDGDVYPHDEAPVGPGKKWRPAKQALMKLSVCAGVIWSVNESRRLDNGANRDYIAYRAVGGIRKADGQPVFFSGEYDIDFEVLAEELRETYGRKAARMLDKSAAQKAEYVDYCVRRDLLQKRKFKLRLCEAGAMNRVLRMLLGLKQAYTTEELSRPFVMARIVFRPDFTDRDVRERFIDASIKAMTGLYGPNAAAPPRVDKTELIDLTPLPEEEDQGDEGDNGDHGGDHHDYPGQHRPAAPDDYPPPPRPRRNDPLDRGHEHQQHNRRPAPPDDLRQPLSGGRNHQSHPIHTGGHPQQPPDDPTAAFESLSLQDKERRLTALAEAKGYDLTGYLKRSRRAAIGLMPPDKQAELYCYLLSLDPQPCDDVPF